MIAWSNNYLRGAAERNEFVLHYPPQIRSNGELVGIEALVCRQFRQWRRQGLPNLSLAADMPTHEFNQPDLATP